MTLPSYRLLTSISSDTSESAPLPLSAIAAMREIFFDDATADVISRLLLSSSFLRRRFLLLLHMAFISRIDFYFSAISQNIFVIFFHITLFLPFTLIACPDARCAASKRPADSACAVSRAP